MSAHTGTVTHLENMGQGNLRTNLETMTIIFWRTLLNGYLKYTTPLLS